MVIVLVSFLCSDAMLTGRKFPKFRRRFLLPSSEKIEAGGNFETSVNFYNTAWLGMPKGSELSVL